MPYDPEDLGAQCYLCVLKEKRVGGPVPPEIHGGETVAVINDVPSQRDCDEQRPLTDGGGMEFTQTLVNIGQHRKKTAIFNAICCRPPENDFDKLMLQWQRNNKKLVAKGEDALPSPIECCRPRLMKEVQGYNNFITLGKVAYKGLTESSSAILEIRGGPIEGRIDDGNFIFKPAPTGGVQAPGNWPVKLMPTIHPGMVTRVRKWTHAFRTDMARAFRFFKDQLNWVEPWMKFTPTPAELKAFIYSADQFAYDTETTVEDATVARLKCITISTGEGGVCIPFYSIETNRSVYNDGDLEEIKQILKAWFTDDRILKTGWNCLHSGTPIRLADGSSMAIEKIVNGKLDLEVLGKDANGRVVPTKVTGWIQNSLKDQRWVVIRHGRMKGGARGLTVTPDHKIGTQRGMVPAHELLIGDQLLLPEMKMSALQRDFLIGTLLGDSNLVVSKTVGDRTKAPGANVRFSHSDREYTFHKLEWLADWSDQHIREEKNESGFSNSSTRYCGSTTAYVQFTEFIDLIHDGTSRYIAQSLLEELGPVGWATWFMDDGNLKKNHDGRETIELALCRYPEETRVRVREIVQKKFGKCSVYKNGSMGFSLAATEKFIQYVSPWIIPSMRYKVPSWVGGAEWNGIIVKSEQTPYTIPITSVEWWDGRGRVSNLRYCLTTETGNFFTAFGLVSNCGGFDVHIIENHLGVTPYPMLDGILLHRLVESELPHRLGYVGSVYTDVTAWKAAHTAKEARSDMELWTYGITDTIVTHRVIEVLAPIVEEKEQDHLVQKDHKIQELCAGMKHVGMWVDRDQRLKEAVRVQAEIIKYKQAAIRASGKPDINLNSTYKLRDLLFTEWDLAPSEYTKSGDPSTGDDALRLIRTQNLSNTQVTTFIDALRMFRRASKEYGTYIARMIPYGQDLKDVNLEWFDEDEREDDPEVARGLIMPDGRIHPNYLAHGTTSGRLSSSNPNSQNFPKHLRAMIKASPGHILVGADADQLELRIIASIAQIPIYLEAFAKGDDPHSHTAAMMFGEHFTKLEKKSTQWKNLRTLAKGIKYASFYGSGDETVHGIVTSGENEKGELLFPDLTLKQLRTIRRKWLGAIPQLPQWWDACLDYYRAYGYMKDPVWGRKRFFLNGEKFNEIVNFGPQCVPGWTRVLTSEGYLPIESLLGREVTAWTGKRWAKARVIPKGIKELYRVHTKRGMHFTCDDEHRGKFVGREGYEWRKFVGEARQNTRFALDLARPLEFGTPMADMDAYMAGYWIGDGHASREGHDGYAVGFTIAATKPNEMDPRAGDMMLTKVQTWAHARGLELKDKAGEGCFTPMIYRGATEWLKSIGADPAWKAHTKRVPNRIWTASLADRKDFIRGYLDSDGHMKKIGRVGIRSCQRDLLQDVMVLARTVGIESSISGPMVVDKNGHEAFELHLSAAQTYDMLGWGQGGKLRTSEVGETPYFEAKRVVDSLLPTCDSDKVIKSRIRYHEPAVSPYVLNRMGADDIYDHDSFVSASTRRVCVPVYTLSVEDEDHQYVAEGIISKNSSGAHIIHEATFRILDQVPFGKWGKGTGMINQCHDALVFEVPYDHDKYEGEDQQFGWCKKGCKCLASEVAYIIKAEMNVSVPGLPGVSFAAKPDIGMRWSEV